MSQTDLKFFNKYLPLIALIGTPWLLGAAEGLSKLEVSADRSAYLAGETATITLRTYASEPSDIYLILTTPSGRRLFADPALQFRRQTVAAAVNYQLAEGQVQVPLSLATAELARPGEYIIEAYLSPPGAGEGSGRVVGQAKFVVSLPGLNFLAIHDAKSPRYDNDCAACHVDKTRNVNLGPGVPSFHTVKYRMFSAGGLTRSCAVVGCHNGADLIDLSQAALRKQSSPEFCDRCHGPFGPGKKLFAK